MLNVSFQSLGSTEPTNIHEVTSNGSAGCHCGAHQMRATALTLTAFEIAV
jgi:hypothetical protein